MGGPGGRRGMKNGAAMKSPLPLDATIFSPPFREGLGEGDGRAIPIPRRIDTGRSGVLD